MELVHPVTVPIATSNPADRPIGPAPAPAPAPAPGSHEAAAAAALPVPDSQIAHCQAQPTTATASNDTTSTPTTRTTRSRPDRVRVVEGSCWSCRKRRTKCDLRQPTCSRCFMVGSTCSYCAVPLKWAGRPAPTAPASYQVGTRQHQLGASLAVQEQRALEYFGGRFWPLLTTVAKPCTPPMVVALEHRVVLLAACVVADTHRILQDGRNSPNMLMAKRGECLAAVREELHGCCLPASDVKPVKQSEVKESLTNLLLAVLLLYFNDGFLECSERWEASTSSHRGGVRAIVSRLGGIETVSTNASESLQMLVSEFASGDLTTALLRGGPPSFEPSAWHTFDKGRVWWAQGPSGRCSLASVLEQMSRMAFYRDFIAKGHAELSMDTVKAFETAVSLEYAPLTLDEASGLDDADSSEEHSAQRTETVNAFHLLRAFQHTALIYLYRAVCGQPVSNPVVQQHVHSCLDTLSLIRKPSKVLNCVIFPLSVAGAHVLAPKQRRTVLKTVNIVHSDMKFASVQAVSQHLSKIWKEDAAEMTWTEMFQDLRHNAVVL